MQFIQGKNRAQVSFYTQCLDETIDQENEVRIIDLFVESINLSEYKFEYKTTTEGRPAYNPKDLLKLFVHGSLNSTKVKVQVKWWSDFVFDPNYKLMPIKDLENFLKQNKHLPSFPSEKTVLADGLDVSEILALQQKQLEELTLYIIELEKKLNELKNK